MAKQMLGLSDELVQLLAAADTQRGFPAGTMAAVMQQETGGNAKYVQDPSTYHYGLNAEGKRIAGHTGKVSTAFGPFGILESTGRDPGYGVKPLQGKDLGEQVRFAADYLAARSKQAGGLEAGLAGYGEGGKYGAQVMARLGKQVTPPKLVPMEQPQTQVAMVEPPVMPPVLAQTPVMVPEPEPWAQFQKTMPKPVVPEQLAYGQPGPLPGVTVAHENVKPNFRMFQSLRGMAA